MKGAQVRVGPAERNAEARVNVFRKARVIRRSEGQPAPKREATRREAQRTLGGDVQSVRIEELNAPRDLRAREERKANVGISGAGQRAEVAGREQLDLVPH